MPPAGTGIGIVTALLGTAAPGGNHKKSPAGTTPVPAQLDVSPTRPGVQVEFVTPPVLMLLHNGPIPLLKLSSYKDVKNPSPVNVALSPHVINARFVKPLDKEMLNSIANDFNGILTIEEGMKTGGFGSYVLNYLNDLDFEGKVKILGIEDKFIDQGTRSELLDECRLTADNIIATIKNE